MNYLVPPHSILYSITYVSHDIVGFDDYMVNHFNHRMCKCVLYIFLIISRFQNKISTSLNYINKKYQITNIPYEQSSEKDFQLHRFLQYRFTIYKLSKR